jgi:two-component system cell cycle response regulator
LVKDNFKKTIFLKLSIKKTKKLDLPIIAVTAYAMIGDRDRILANGFNNYIPKPLDPKIFVSQIEMHIPQQLRSGYVPNLNQNLNTPKNNFIKPNNYVILLIDDEPSNIMVLQETLELSGYTTLIATNGNQALKILNENLIHLILADLHLKDEEDFDFIDKINQNDIFSKIPFIYISSTAEKQILSDIASSKGAKAFLFRPIRPEALLLEIERCIRGL